MLESQIHLDRGSLVCFAASIARGPIISVLQLRPTGPRTFLQRHDVCF
jgi:hypothetical protein